MTWAPHRLAFVAGVAAGVAVLLAVTAQLRTREWAVQLQQLPAARMPRVASPPEAPPPDPARSWPEQPRATAALHVATRLAQATAVDLRSLAIESAPSHSAAVARADVLAEFRASYPDAKRWLGELLREFPEMAVIAFEMQAIDGAGKPQADAPARGAARLRFYARADAQRAPAVPPAGPGR